MTGEHAPQSVTGFDRLADRLVERLAGMRRASRARREEDLARRASGPAPWPVGEDRWAKMDEGSRRAAVEAMDAAVDSAATGLGLMTYGAAAERLAGPVSRALAMRRAGASEGEVLRRTRYQRGPFGYGVETRRDAALRPSVSWSAAKGATKTAGGPLLEVADVHPDVVQAYPDIGRVGVKVVPDDVWDAVIAKERARLSELVGDGRTGAYARRTDTVFVRGQMEGEGLAEYSDRADRTLVHELQHAAQGRDGLGGAAYGPYRTRAAEVDARNSAARVGFTPEERAMPEGMRIRTQDVRPEDVHMDDKGGDINGRHRDFRNFLATDDVPESIFGIPVVQGESQYTEKDIAFFRENPKAAGFYDLGDEGDDGTQEALGAGKTRTGADAVRKGASTGQTRGKYPGISNNPGNVEKHEIRTDKTLFEGEDSGGKRPKRFARFTDPVLGLKAAAAVLARHADGLAEEGKPFTIENYAPIYAPDGENDTEGYIKNISEYSGIARDAAIDRWDTEALARLLKAKVRFETSPEASQWFTDEEYKEAAEKLQEGAFD